MVHSKNGRYLIGDIDNHHGTVQSRWWTRKTWCVDCADSMELRNRAYVLPSLHFTCVRGEGLLVGS